MDNNQPKKLPHLIVIGSQKSGTTWLQHVMDNNDQFFCPAIRQEISFFSNYWEKGMDYYKGLYKSASDTQVTVDVSPRYQELATTPERIHQFSQTTDRDVKLVLICREPVSRLESAYKMYIKQGHGYKSLKEALERTPDLVEKGLYQKTLEQYYKYFDPKDILVLFFDDLKGDSDKLLAELQTFCGVSQPIVNSYENVRINNGGKRKSVLLAELIRYSGRTLRFLGLTTLIHNVKRTKMVRNIRDFNEIPFELSEADHQLLKTLKPVFEKDVSALASLTGKKDLPSTWGYTLNVLK